MSVAENTFPDHNEHEKWSCTLESYQTSYHIIVTSRPDSIPLILCLFCCYRYCYFVQITRKACDYEKQHACFYCGQQQKNQPTHSHSTLVRNASKYISFDV